MVLTDDDKEWIMLRFQEFGAKIDSKIDTRISNVELDAKIEKLEAKLDSKIEKVETSLLTAFHQWASPFETRQRSHSMVMRALDEEVDLLKDRVSRLEQRA